VSLRLYDTASRQTRDFTPRREGHVGIYLCGATVQAPPHVGHIRSGVSFDVLRRWLEYRDYTVTFVRNVTDIDDKILQRGLDEDVPYWQVAQRNERAFTWAYDVLGCLPPTIEPRATGHVTEMVELMHRLIDAGHAYAVDGDVYFDVRSFPAYGALSGQRPDDMLPAADSEAVTVKRDVRDFALWKGVKSGEPSWPTPWGDGRPGWHLECSAMARKYLGADFDIHGGGLDLIFPHHENEIAQSKAAGDGFAEYWMHNAWVTTSGEKMSKSLGNSLLVSEVVKRVRPIELRYYLASAHYRSMIEYSDESLREAGAGYRRLEGFVRRAVELVGEGERAAVPQAFADAMNDDLGVPAALAVLHDAVTEGNKLLASGASPALVETLAQVRGMLDVLGVDPLAEPWVSSGGAGGDDSLRRAADALVTVVLEQRQAARARKDYAAADAIRDQLSQAGVVIEDTPQGPRWSLAADGDANHEQE
jgi:cysteinyl-tRNA synthetase